jgi:hypothetical protein
MKKGITNAGFMSIKIRFFGALSIKRVGLGTRPYAGIQPEIPPP